MNILFSQKKIQSRVKEIAAEIASDFQTKQPVVIGVLNGSYIFASDLTKAIWEAGLTNFQVDFVGVSSYGDSKQSNKKPTLTKDLKIDITNRHIIIVEDIIDTGLTVDFLIKEFTKRSPQSITTVAFLSKPSKHEVKTPINYVGFEIENVWVEGYGLDSAEFGRANPNIIVKD
jgi:hypoxanthine phosphoribosyltransferase